jgi:ankyrin repeat protein
MSFKYLGSSSVAYVDDTCLHISSLNGHIDIVELILNDGRIDPMAIDTYGDTCWDLGAGENVSRVELSSYENYQ